MKIYSHNLGGNNDDPERRLHDFSDRVLAARPDLMLLQGVSHDIGYNALMGLKHQLGTEYQIRFEEVYPGKERKLGMVVLSQLPIVGSKQTHFGGQATQSQIVELESKDKNIVVANVHHSASLLERMHRKLNNIELADQLTSEYSANPQILGGGFGDVPRFSPVRVLTKKGKFQSAYHAVHRRHDVTFPTLGVKELTDRRYLTSTEAELLHRAASLTNLVTHEKHDIPSVTLDYIFLRNFAQPTSANRVRDWRDVPADKLAETVTNRGTINAWPISAHYGLEIEVPSPTEL